ncbi:hypothetical protein BCR44DRAFT_1482429 [Catenaria anguillulae PL171]|uniref:Ricin B lectin domain-containing protein n=1 Tax=Catenaria anguillulae PL171 TaxID=765915 RepID=A0A1Y2HZ76_9FUNG|nr:hypothetical protein BCR44DRAFT_1482429 [Catenaria anguillulae PL171]
MPLNLVFVLAALANLATAIPLNETSLIPNTTNSTCGAQFDGPSHDCAKRHHDSAAYSTSRRLGSFGPQRTQTQLYEPYYSYCLDVAEAKFFNGAAVRCNYSKAQQWGYNPQFGHIYPIARPDLCLDPVGGIRGSFDGQGMQLWKCVKGEQGHNWDLADWISPVCRP